MFKQGFLAFIITAAAAAVSASPAATPKLTPSTKFTGNIADAVIGSHSLTSSASSSLEKRQYYGTYDGTVYLCGYADCSGDCIAISTQGAGAYNNCLITAPNPFYSVLLANPPTGYFYPFYLGINIGPTACPYDIAEITQANTCYNVNPEGNGWTLENGDIDVYA